MILHNNSKEFTLQYEAVEHIIPNGEFEVVNKFLANHILYIAKKWDKDVKTIDDKKLRVEPTRGST